MSDFAIVGKSVPRIDAPVKATGAAQYVDDLVLPRMLHARVLHSSYAHARIVNIDTSRALQLPGVKAVITGRDILPKKYGILPLTQDEYALAIDKVRYVGDDVAAVCAVDADTAEEALALIRVEYEPLPAVFDPEDAMKPGAPVIHEEVPDNISVRIVKDFGDVEKGFAEAEYVREDRFYTQMVNHCSMEPHGAVAQWDPNGEKLTLWSATQIPFFLRYNVARTLGVAESQVRIIKPHVGGAFGQKLDMFAKDFCAAYFARELGRPVKCMYDREEVFVSTRQRHPMIMYLKTGVKKDGTLTAQKWRFYADGGAYNSTGVIMITIAAYFLMIPYGITNLHTEGHHVYTNKPIAGAYRGHGVPQVRFAVESQLDMIAEDLGLNPVELRARNAIRAHEPHPAGYVIKSCGFTESIEKATAAAGWEERAGKLPFGHGIGIACSSFPSGVAPVPHASAGAIIKILPDGRVTLLTGAADIGQGAESVLAQITAEELGVRLQDISVTAADTDLTPMDPGTFGSGVTLRAGNAAKLAAAEAKAKIFEVVAEKLECSPGDLVAREGRIWVQGSPDRGMSFTTALKNLQSADKPVPVVGNGFYQPGTVDPIGLLHKSGNFSPAYSFMTQVAEVKVDEQTGQVELVRMVTAHDCGRAINPQQVDGQMEGSVAAGVGQALYEELLIDESDGRTLNASFLDYKMPTAVDLSAEIVSVPVETDDPEGPFGCKEAGEGTLVPTPAAVANAVYDAIGVRIYDLPITPQKILQALEAKKREKHQDALQAE